MHVNALSIGAAGAWTYSCKDVVQSDICECSDRGYTEHLGVVDVRRIERIHEADLCRVTEVGRLDQIRGIEVTTAAELSSERM